MPRQKYFFSFWLCSDYTFDIRNSCVSLVHRWRCIISDKNKKMQRALLTRCCHRKSFETMQLEWLNCVRRARCGITFSFIWNDFLLACVCVFAPQSVWSRVWVFFHGNSTQLQNSVTWSTSWWRWHNVMWDEKHRADRTYRPWTTKLNVGKEKQLSMIAIALRSLWYVYTLKNLRNSFE